MTNSSLPRLEISAFSQTLRFLKDPFSLLQEASRELGEIFALKIYGFGDWVFLCSPELFREMCRAPADVLVAGENNRKMLGFMLGDNATFTLDGDAHRRRHRRVYPHLNGPRTHQHIPAMREIALQALSRWPVGEPFSFLHHGHRMSLDVMTHAMFAGSGRDRVDELADLFYVFATEGLRSKLIMMPYLHWDLGPWSPWGRILQMRRDVVAAFKSEIAERVERRDEDPAPDVISALARTPQTDGDHISAEALLDEVINLLFAGHETTGNGITWTMETLHSHPEVLERVRDELGRVLQGGPIEGRHLRELTYLEAVVQETLRYRPMAPMAGVRKVNKSVEIGGYILPEGTLVTQAFPVMANRPGLFANPDRFDPDHFFERKTKPFEWNPFGGGTRMCIGRGLAEVELKVIIATLLQHAEFKLGQDEVHPVRSGFFFSPNHGLRVVVERRLDSHVHQEAA